MATNKSYNLPMGEKYMLTIREAAVYFGIGIKQLRRFAEKNEGGFAMRYGNRFLICRPRFEAYLTKLMTKGIPFMKMMKTNHDHRLSQPVVMIAGKNKS